MQGRSVVIAALLCGAVLMGGAAGADACEGGYSEVSAEVLKESRAVLMNNDADAFDRLFAFQGLVCSNNPTIRAFAVREGLKVQEQMVREQVVFDAMMQLARLDISLHPAKGAAKEIEAEVQRIGGVWSQIIRLRSPTDGCLSLYRSDVCEAHNAAFIKGSRLIVTYDNLTGEFDLTDDDKFVGYVKFRSDWQKVPASISIY